MKEHPEGEQDIRPAGERRKEGKNWRRVGGRKDLKEVEGEKGTDCRRRKKEERERKGGKKWREVRRLRGKWRKKVGIASGEEKRIMEKRIEGRVKEDVKEDEA